MFAAMTQIDNATKKLLRDPVKRRAWVNYQLSLRGESLASLARRYGVDRRTPRRAFCVPYPRMEQAIARRDWGAGAHSVPRALCAEW